MELRFKCSPEQEEVIADHALSTGNGPLYIQPDERAWIVANARKQVPGCVVKSADLDIENGTWVVQVE